MRSKLYESPEAAVADVFDGAVVLVAGFAGCGRPEGLLQALKDREVSNLTVICQGPWPESPAKGGPAGVDGLIAAGRVAKLISPDGFYPGHGAAAEEGWRNGSLEVEVIPQGVLAERLRAGGAGLGGVFVPTGVDSRFAEGKELRSINGQRCVFEAELRADFAFLRAYAADTLGNLVYQVTQRNWNPVMAMAARLSIAEVDEVFEAGGLDPELVTTPGIFVNRMVRAV
jgi:3-oxoacid CoA-transferase A subunit